MNIYPIYKNAIDADILNTFYNRLTSPLDGKWEEVIFAGNLYAIECKDCQCGFFSINTQNELLVFFIDSKFMNYSRKVFECVLKEFDIKTAYASTNNSSFFSICCEYSKSRELSDYLFKDSGHVSNSDFSDDKGFKFISCIELETFDLPAFYQNNIDCCKEWALDNTQNLIKNNEIFALVQNQNTIAGICEIRRSKSQPGITDIGVIVAKEFRGQKLGSKMIAKAKETVYKQNSVPLCSCSKHNKISMKMIEENGFILENFVYKMSF